MVAHSMFIYEFPFFSFSTVFVEDGFSPRIDRSGIVRVWHRVCVLFVSISFVCKFIFLNVIIHAKHWIQIEHWFTMLSQFYFGFGFDSIRFDSTYYSTQMIQSIKWNWKHARTNRTTAHNTWWNTREQPNFSARDRENELRHVRVQSIHNNGRTAATLFSTEEEKEKRPKID